MDANQRSVKSNPAALLPIGVFLVLYLGCGLLFEYGLKIEQGLSLIHISEPTRRS